MDLRSLDVLSSAECRFVLAQEYPRNAAFQLLVSSASILHRAEMWSRIFHIVEGLAKAYTRPCGRIFLLNPVLPP